MKPLRILIADDHEVVRRGIRSLLEEQPGWEVCADAVTGRDAVAKVKQWKPDVVVIDIAMPELNGLEATRQIRAALPECEVLVLTMHDSEAVVREVLSAGARGYLLKSDAGRDLVHAVTNLAQHKPFFTPNVTSLVLEGYLQQSGHPNVKDGNRQLTAREREIVQLLAEGKSSKEVAVVLGISTRTGETHRANIMRKLGVHSISELVRYAIRNGLIEP